MPRFIGVAAVALLMSGIAWSARAVFGDGELANGSATLVGIDVILLTLVAVVGLLLVRARWARYLGIGILLAQAALLPALEAGPITYGVGAATAVALVLVAGPWLPRRLRHHPAADGPPLPAVVLLLALLTLPAVAGLASPSTVEAGHLILAVSGPLLAWWLGRAHASGLWAARLGLPIAGGLAVVASPVVGAIAIGAVTSALVLLAWRHDLRVAVSPLATMPGATYRVPPELAPPEILEAAGLDEHGRRTQ